MKLEHKVGVIAGAKITFVCPPKMSYNRTAVEKFDLIFKRVNLTERKKNMNMLFL